MVGHGRKFSGDAEGGDRSGEGRSRGMTREVRTGSEGVAMSVRIGKERRRLERERGGGGRMDRTRWR